MEITIVTLVEEQISSWKGNLPKLPIIIKYSAIGTKSIGLEWSGDQVKLERWQGMVRSQATRSDKDGLLGVQGEEVVFFLVPKVTTRLGVTRSFTGFALDIGAIVGFVSEDEDGGLAFEEFSEDIKEDEKYFYSAENSFCGKKSL
ncbi:hypothetical protein Tco_0722339 [Tanacetum coccineum]